jgi:hypothetical protein
VNCKLEFRAQRRLGRAPHFLESRLSAESRHVLILKIRVNPRNLRLQNEHFR